MKLLFSTYELKLSLGIITLLISGCANNDNISNDSNRADKPALSLPIITDFGESSCVLDEVLRDEPSLEAWLAAPHANIIGTIQKVTLIKDPVVYLLDADGEDYRIISRDECAGDPGYRAEIVLTDVESLYGEEVPGDELRLRIRLQEAGSSLLPPIPRNDGGPGIFPEPYEGAFAPGARIGAAINRASASGDYFLNAIRLFEVYDGKIYLQEVANDSISDALSSPDQCPPIPFWGLSLPERYDGQSLDELRDDIAQLTVDISTVRQNNRTVDAFITAYENIPAAPEPNNLAGYHPVCLDILDGVDPPQGGTGGDGSTEDSL